MSDELITVTQKLAEAYHINGAAVAIATGDLSNFNDEL
jgi:hypothetical protein